MILEHVKPMALDERAAAVSELVRQCETRLPTDLMMRPEDVRKLVAQGMEVGGHTRRHPILRSMSASVAQAEISNCRDDLASIVGEPPALFAFPNGRRGVDFEDVHCQMVEAAGFKYSFSTEKNRATARSDRFAIPRFTPWDRTRLKFKARMVQHLAGL